MSGFIKNAQEYAKWRNTFRLGNVGRWVSEKLFGKYKDKMYALRELDETLRQIALGQSPEINRFNISLKSALGNAQTAYEKNKYVDAAFYISLINEILMLVVKTGEDAAKNLSTLGEEYFLGEGPEEGVLEYFDEEAAVKEAQFMQKLYKGLFGDPLEKAFAKEIKTRKAAMGSFLNYVNTAVVSVLAGFDRMGVARATGDISGWLNEFKKISTIQKTLNARVNDNYKKQIKPLVELAKKLNKENALSDNPTNALGFLSIIEPAAAEPMKAPVEEKVEVAPKVEPVIEEPKKAPGRPLKRVTDQKKADEQLAKLISHLKDEQLEQMSKAIEVSKENQEDAEAVAEVMRATVSGEEGQVVSDKGEVIGDIGDDTAVVTMRSGRIIEIDKEIAPVLLKNMENTGIVEKVIEEPIPEPKPIIEEKQIPPIVEEPKVEPTLVEKAPEVKKDVPAKKTVPAEEPKKIEEKPVATPAVVEEKPTVIEEKPPAKKRGRPPKKRITEVEPEEATIIPKDEPAVAPKAEPVKEEKPVEKPAPVVKPQVTKKQEELSELAKQLNPEAIATLKKNKFDFADEDVEKLLRYSPEDQKQIAHTYSLYAGMPKSEWWKRIDDPKFGWKPIEAKPITTEETKPESVKKETKLTSSSGLATAFADESILSKILADSTDPVKKQHKEIGSDDYVFAIFEPGTIKGEDQLESIRKLLAKATGRKEFTSEDGDTKPAEDKIILVSSSDKGTLQDKFTKLMKKKAPISAILLEPNPFTFQMKEEPLPEAKPIQPTASYKEFYQSLTKAASVEHMALMMIDYSDEISKLNPKLSKQLYRKAQELLK